MHVHTVCVACCEQYTMTTFPVFQFNKVSHFLVAFVGTLQQFSFNDSFEMFFSPVVETTKYVCVYFGISSFVKRNKKKHSTLFTSV